MTKAEYQEALKKAEARTPSLEEFRRMEAYDDNVVWRLDQGHIVNLLDMALEEIDRLNEEIERMEKQEVETWLTNPH
jgi:hypothetical protein